MYYYPDNDICKTQNAETLQAQQVIFSVPTLAHFLDVIFLDFWQIGEASLLLMAATHKNASI